MRALFRLAVAAFLVLLPACSTVQNAQKAYQVVSGVRITRTQLNQAKIPYDALLTAFNAYRYEDAAYTIPRRYCTKSQPFTVARPCAQYSVLVKLKPAIEATEAAFKTLDAQVTACEEAGDQSACSGMAVTIKAFNAAMGAASRIAASFGIGV